MKRLLFSVLVILFLFSLSACAGGNRLREDGTTAAAPEEPGPSENDPPEEQDPEEEVFFPVLRFVVCSDIHISEEGGLMWNRVEEMMETSYAYSRSQPYQALDAVVVCGDLTDDGSAEQLRLYRKLMDGCVLEGTTLLSMLGNHEHFSHNRLAPYRSIVDTSYHNHLVINGYHFISVSPTEEENAYTADATDWLREQVSDAASDAPDQPIFVFQHHHLKDTVYGSHDLWTTESTPAFRAAFEGFPQVIDFSGHSHAPINHPLSIWQDEFTMLATGTLRDLDLELGMTGGAIPDDKFQVAQFYIVEVDSGNTVKIMPYDLIAGDFFRTPSNTDDPAEQLIYVLSYPADPASFPYTGARRDTAAAPYFSADAALAVSFTESESGPVASFTAPQAFDDACIYSYRLVLRTEAGAESEYRYFARFFFEPLADSETYTVRDPLPPATSFCATLYPVNAWNIEGEPIVLDFVTPDS